MGLVVKDYVNGCHTNQDGETIYSLIAPLLKKGEDVTLSFREINSVSSSFLNSALVPLLEDISYDQIKSQLKITDSNKFINNLIITRLKQETEQFS